MGKNDFIGSFADENVKFQTQVIRTTTVGDNYYKVMLFVESDHYVDATSADWTQVPGSGTAKALTVTADTYATYTTGLLKSWLYDLFAEGFTGDCILVAVGDAGAVTAESLTATYELLKAYAYFKTELITGAVDSDVLDTDIAVKFAETCQGDKNLLSSVPFYPLSNVNPAEAGDDKGDKLYKALTASSGADAFMAYHPDTNRNAALFSLGVALAVNNGSGTPIGNALDMVSTSSITASGADGTNLSAGIKSRLEGLNIQYFKTVGDNSGNVAAVGYLTLKGAVIAAQWIVCYVAYMVKVNVARLLTTRNFLKTEYNYTRILNTMINYLSLFGPAGSGRLEEITVTAPSFKDLPDQGDEIVISNAWTAQYADLVRKVTITGALYISA